MERRDTLGGTSPNQVRRQIEDAKVKLALYDEEANGFAEEIPEGY